MSKSIVLYLSLTVIAVVALSTAADAVSFATGDLVLSEVGSGTTALVNTGDPMSLVEYTTAGSLVQSIAIPSTGPTGLEPSGSAASEGHSVIRGRQVAVVRRILRRSRRQYRHWLADATAAVAPRGYGSVSYAGAYTFGGTFGGFYSGNNVRGEATDNGTNFWGVGTTATARFWSPATP